MLIISSRGDGLKALMGEKWSHFLCTLPSPTDSINKLWFLKKENLKCGWSSEFTLSPLPCFHMFTGWASLWLRVPPNLFFKHRPLLSYRIGCTQLLPGPSYLDSSWETTAIRLIITHLCACPAHSSSGSPFSSHRPRWKILILDPAQLLTPNQSPNPFYFAL